MKYYTSDLHFDYEVMLKHRPFDTVEEMDQAIIDGINSRCTRNDTLYILGDVSAYGRDPIPALKKLKPKLILVKGNHDEALLKGRHFRHCFQWIYRDQAYVRDGKYDILLSHYPMTEWDGTWKGRWLFYGHVHQGDTFGARIENLFCPTAINVGVDACGFLPHTAEELISMRKQTYHKPTMEDFQKLSDGFWQNDGRQTRKQMDLSWIND